jgi:hypothetical protein
MLTNERAALIDRLNRYCDLLWLTKDPAFRLGIIELIAHLEARLAEMDRAIDPDALAV